MNGPRCGGVLLYRRFRARRLSTAGPEVGDGIAIIRMTRVNREEARYGLPVYSMSKFRYMHAPILPSFSVHEGLQDQMAPVHSDFCCGFHRFP